MESCSTGSAERATTTSTMLPTWSAPFAAPSPTCMSKESSTEVSNWIGNQHISSQKPQLSRLVVTVVVASCFFFLFSVLCSNPEKPECRWSTLFCICPAPPSPEVQPSPLLRFSSQEKRMHTSNNIYTAPHPFILNTRGNEADENQK